MDLPSFASGPVPTITSLTTSLVGGGPLCLATAGSLESGPLVGVFAVVEVVLALTSVLSAVFSLPTVIVLEEPLEPQPAITAAAASAASGMSARRQEVGTTLE